MTSQRKAHALVNRAIRDGELTRPTTCQGCGAAKRIRAHHEDYNRPLDVVWLCDSCHGKRHAEIGSVRLEPEPKVLFLRNVPVEVIARIRRRAAARGLKVEDYISRLVELHGDMLHDAEYDEAVAAVLDARGLGRVLD